MSNALPRKRLTPEHVKRAADRAALRSEGRDPDESPTDAGHRSDAGQRSAPAQRLSSSTTGWPISLSFLGLVGTFLGSAAAMLAFPTYARWGVFPLVLAGWLVSLCLHEFGHAIVAYGCGDRSVRAKGYLTLDLVRYTHLQYSIVLPLVFLAFGGIGLPGGAVYINMRCIAQPSAAFTGFGGRPCGNTRCPSRLASDPDRRARPHRDFALRRVDVPGIPPAHRANLQSDVMRSLHFLNERRVNITFGPGRHPSSSAKFLYFEGPDGMTFEYSSGVRSIADELLYRERQLRYDPKGFCEWGAKPQIKEFM